MSKSEWTQFVKDNYKFVESLNPGLCHKDFMRILGESYRLKQSTEKKTSVKKASTKKASTKKVSVKSKPKQMKRESFKSTEIPFLVEPDSPELKRRIKKMEKVFSDVYSDVKPSVKKSSVKKSSVKNKKQFKAESVDGKFTVKISELAMRRPIFLQNSSKRFLDQEGVATGFYKLTSGKKVPVLVYYNGNEYFYIRTDSKTRNAFLTKENKIVDIMQEKKIKPEPLISRNNSKRRSAIQHYSSDDETLSDFSDTESDDNEDFVQLPRDSKRRFGIRSVDGSGLSNNLSGAQLRKLMKKRR